MKSTDPSYSEDGMHAMTLQRAVNIEEGLEGEVGYLNPTWCEWFMGFPMGWLDDVSLPSATRSSRKSRNGSAGGS